MERRKRTKARIDELRKIVGAQHLVCDCEDVLPFAWRTPPVVEKRRCSKVLTEMGEAAKERALPPVPAR